MSNNLATAWLGLGVGWGWEWGWAYTPNWKHWHTVPWPSTVRWIAVFPRLKHKPSYPVTAIRHPVGYSW